MMAAIVTKGDHPSDEGLCTQCFRPLDDPRVLTCLHSFCKSCIEHLSSASEVTCPSCQVSSPLPANGADGLQIDLTVTPTVEKDRCCFACAEEGEDGKADLWCGTCKQLFCQSHGIQHMLSTVAHALEVPSPKEQTSPGTSEEETTICSEHNKQALYFCEPCGSPVCGDCFKSGGAHREHDPVRSFEELSEAIETRLAAKIDTINRHSLPRVEESVKALDMECTNSTRDVEHLRLEAALAREQGIHSVEAAYQQRLLEIEDLENERLKPVHKQQAEAKRLANNIRGAAQFGQKVLAQKRKTGQACSLLRLVERRIESLQRTEIDKQPAEHIPLASFSKCQPDEVLALANRMLGKIESPNAISPRNTCVQGERTKICQKAESVEFVIETRSMRNEPLTKGGHNVQLQQVHHAGATSHGARAAIGDVIDENTGIYKVRCTPNETGHFDFSISVDGVELSEGVAIQCIEQHTRFDITKCQSGLAVSPDRKTFTHFADNCFASLLGTGPLPTGTHAWSVQVKFTGACFGYVGVAASDAVEKERSYQHCYGWGTRTGTKWVMGELSESNQKCESGDVLRLTFDSKKHLLEITNSRTGHKSEISDLPNQELYPLFHLFFKHDSMTLVE